MKVESIRNFCILAHIDHGKSTLADRFLELTGTVERRKLHEQYLDMHPLERERGITIKMTPVRMTYTPTNAQVENYILNLIDTPGHVDFTYEVSRALAAVEGAILLVDATQGVQAQTIANLHLAQEERLVIIPVINKIDLPSAQVEQTEQEIRDLLDVASAQILRVSAKTGEGVEQLLYEVVKRIPSPYREFKSLKNLNVTEPPLRALIFDSLYDPYQGIIAHVRIVDGCVRPGERILLMASKASAEVGEVGIFSPHRVQTRELTEGEIGYIATGIKESDSVRVGDTVTQFNVESLKFKSEHVQLGPLPGYREPVSMVFASVFPENQDEYEQLRDALQKLKLNDAALTFEPEAGLASLGRGFRSGFLGMLHMEIVSERLRREYKLSLVFSNPSVAFRVHPLGGVPEAYTVVCSAMKMPDLHQVSFVEEPWVSGEIVAPSRFLGALNTLIYERGGAIAETSPLAGNRLVICFTAPLREIIVDFHDVLKSVSQGFASFSYALGEYRRTDVVRLDILVAGQKVPAFSEIVPHQQAYAIGRMRVQKLKDVLPAQLFSVALQAEVEGRILARETIPAMRKDVTGYLYGGDRTRKMKLWKKQQRGKKRLKDQAHVDISSEVFLKMLRRS